ncbi:MAG: hypothetical protein LBS35_00545 [Synergistaceae bacterium]|nr:hypothetical protein [Synergistaceae bacterium]
MCLHLTEVLKAITIDCKDNGRIFTNQSRIRYISDRLSVSKYSLRKYPDNNLALIYEHNHFAQNTERSDIVVISTHIDCVYWKLFVEDQGECFLGTFDNSATNAAVLHLMCQGMFNEYVAIAFTGDEEEEEGEGAEEVAKYYAGNNYHVKSIIVCDLTNAKWRIGEDFTVENLYEADVSRDYYRRRQLSSIYRTESAFSKAIFEPLHAFTEKVAYIRRAEPDETDNYSEHGFACFTFCLPCRGDMHSERGVLIRKKSLEIYAKALASLANSL